MVIMLNFPAPEEGIHHQEPNTTAFFGDKEIGRGTVYITENVFCWISLKGEGFSIEYPSIFIHAVSRDTTHFPHECLLVMIDSKIALGEICEGAEETDLAQSLNALRVSENGGDENGAADDGASENKSENVTNELRFVPENRNMLDAMFQALSDCQALNPEPGELSDDDGSSFPTFNIQNGFVAEEDEDEGDYDMDEDQFEDAEA